MTITSISRRGPRRDGRVRKLDFSLEQVPRLRAARPLAARRVGEVRVFGQRGEQFEHHGSPADSAHPKLSVLAGLTDASAPDDSEVRDDPRSMTLRSKHEEVEVFLARVRGWAATRSDVHALALVGSWTRNAANQGSDVDLVLLVDDPADYLTDEAWAKELGATSILRTESWGAVTERRLALPSGLEVDVGIAMPSWAATKPVDAGTARVVSAGIRILLDRHGALARLTAAVRD